jgi:hypothetical protein
LSIQMVSYHKSSPNSGVYLDESCRLVYSDGNLSEVKSQ